MKDVLVEPFAPAMTILAVAVILSCLSRVRRTSPTSCSPVHREAVRDGAAARARREPDAPAAAACRRRHPLAVPARRQVANGTRCHHTGQRANRPEHIFVVLHAGRRHSHDERIRRLESGIDREQTRKALRRQARADDEHHRVLATIKRNQR